MKLFFRVSFNYLDKGCNSGGVACLNGGKCLSTGSCECSIGYKGTTCGEC